MTAPGAPLTVLAVPASTPPSPSPNHQTPNDQATEAASAALRVGRHAMPSARNICTVANAALVHVGWASIRRADQLTGPAITAGSPAAVAASIWPNPWVKKN